MKPSSNHGEWGAFPLKYSDVEVHEIFDTGTYVSAILGQDGDTCSDPSAIQKVSKGTLN